MYLDWKDREVFCVDVEGDSLTPTVLWCMCWRNIKTGETGECTNYESIKQFFTDHAGATFVGHNILKFDAPVLVKFCGVGISVSNCIDTLVLSTLYSPSIENGHSLGAWGTRLGEEKGDFSDFEGGLSPEMLKYCHQDVLVTSKLFVRLMKTLARIGFTEQSLWIQHRLTVLLDRQQRNGFKFDGKRALSFYQHLRSREAALGDSIHEVFPPERVRVASRSMFKKDGSPTAIFLKDSERYILQEYPAEGRYEAYEDVEFNIGSPAQRVEKLVSLGWVPEEFTDKGNPRPFDKGDLSPSLKALLENNPIPEIEYIAKWMSINGRANMVRTWLDNWDEEDGCIHGKLFVADTLRLRHQAPNTANVPAVRVDKQTKIPILGEDGYYTYEARDLWVSRAGRVLVGTDAAGLELRMLAHFLGSPDFTKQVIEGDPHQYNADLVGITKPQAKTLIYATLYGAGPPKIARTLGMTLAEGTDIRQMFLDRLGVGDLIKECKDEQKRGRVSLVDGSHVICPSPHAALNYKLQGSGARVMALGACLLERHIQRDRVDVLKVGDIHDEWQYDCHPDCAEHHATRSVQAIRESGEALKLNVPLDGTAKIGGTWAETH